MRRYHIYLRQVFNIEYFSFPANNMSRLFSYYSYFIIAINTWCICTNRDCAKIIEVFDSASVHTRDNCGYIQTGFSIFYTNPCNKELLIAV